LQGNKPIPTDFSAHAELRRKLTLFLDQFQDEIKKGNIR
jgi:hypothetical protein